MSDSATKTGSGPSDEDRDLTTGPVWKALAQIAGPMMLGLLSVLSVSLVDTFFVGKLGTDQLAALSFAFPVTVIVTGLCIGMGVGTSAIVSQRTGEGDDDAARAASLDGTVLALLLVSAVSLIGALLTKPLFGLLGAEEKTLGYIVDYMPIYFMSVPFLALSIVLHNISRAVGEAKWPTGIMAVSGLLNIGVTAVLVFGLGPVPELGIMGAALGTLIARAAIVWTSVWLVTKKLNMITWTLPDFRKVLPAWWDILKVAAPSGAGNMVNPFSITLVTAILAGLSQSTVAGFGVAQQVQSVATIPLLAMSAALGPIAGQNWGAGKPERTEKTLKLAFGLSLGIAVGLAVIFWFFGEPIASIFASEDEVAKQAAEYLRIVPLSFFGFGMVIVSAAAFNAVDQAGRGLAFYIFRSGLFYVPLACLGAQLAEAKGVYLGIAVANAVSGLAVAAYALWWLKRNRDKAGDGAGEAES